jgi:hypothetical protein
VKIKFKKIAKSLTGISTPVFGVSWSPPESEREVVKKLITFLEDRRALYNPFNMETGEWVIESVMEIRKRLTEILQALDQGSDIGFHLRAMRAACRRFLDETGQGARRWALRLAGLQHNGEFCIALGELRAVFGVHIAQLCVKYGVDVEDDLAAILPVEDE